MIPCNQLVLYRVRDGCGHHTDAEQLSKHPRRRQVLRNLPPPGVLSPAVQRRGDPTWSSCTGGTLRCRSVCPPVDVKQREGGAVVGVVLVCTIDALRSVETLGDGRVDYVLVVLRSLVRGLGGWPLCLLVVERFVIVTVTVRTVPGSTYAGRLEENARLLREVERIDEGPNAGQRLDHAPLRRVEEYGLDRRAAATSLLLPSPTLLHEARNAAARPSRPWHDEVRVEIAQVDVPLAAAERG